MISNIALCTQVKLKSSGEVYKINSLPFDDGKQISIISGFGQRIKVYLEELELAEEPTQAFSEFMSRESERFSSE